ncbi:membrane-associated phospholipid phosphatase [Streptococcus varani]|uniref:Membrane-associated phospholipid phosphatase n=1 Tax=Streptococcus varani TaxID=1608583 RepID=A0A0E4CTH4_9STRE|nr:phosphatase PAP2 family protein [Streptococcus varani]CQR25755.1 membrane-associated phospholipid phosphatase [Streptococcus varani]
MKNSLKHYKNASYAALFFVMLGYVVKFYPDYLVGFDRTIQMAIRGNLPQMGTSFWTTVTKLGNVVSIFGFVFVLAVFFYWKRWKAESYFLVGSLILMAGVSSALKFLYQRPRPTIEWLIDTVGYSYPSWHTASTMLVAGVLVIVLNQRCQNKWLKYLGQALLVIIAILVALSRVYIGVHFPTDIIGGWLLALALLFGLYPTYDRYRFTWRFQSKQK